mgnify:CR=1 FL=1
MKGFILSQSYRSIEGMSYVLLFGKLENNQSFLVMNKYEPYFYVRTKDAKKVKHAQVESTDLKNFNEE